MDRVLSGYKKPGNRMGNFFEYIQDGGIPISDAWSHHRNVSLYHVANIAIRLDRPPTGDPKAENFGGMALASVEANAMLGREQRDGYRIDATFKTGTTTEMQFSLRTTLLLMLAIGSLPIWFSNWLLLFWIILIICVLMSIKGFSDSSDEPLNFS